MRKTTQENTLENEKPLHTIPVVTYRPAVLSDALGLLPLMEQLGYPQTIESMIGLLDSYKDTEKYGVFVAERDGGSLLGVAAVSIRYLFVVPYKKASLEALIVDENYRGHGIGRRLMHHIEAFARAKDAGILDLTSGLRREKDGTHHFYKSLGYDNSGTMAKLYLRKVLKD